MSQISHRVAVRPYDGIFSRYIGFIYETRGTYERSMGGRGVIRGRTRERVIAKARRKCAQFCREVEREEMQRAQERSHVFGACP